MTQLDWCTAAHPHPRHHVNTLDGEKWCPGHSREAQDRVPFEFTARPEEPLNLRRAVQEVVGRASVCWEPMDGTGVFDSTTAIEISDKLIRWIEQNYVRADSEKRYILVDTDSVLTAIGVSNGLIVLDMEPPIELTDLSREVTNPEGDTDAEAL